MYWVYGYVLYLDVISIGYVEGIIGCSSGLYVDWMWIGCGLSVNMYHVSTLVIIMCIMASA